jgi:hypothetical protein
MGRSKVMIAPLWAPDLSAQSAQPSGKNGGSFQWTLMMLINTNSCNRFIHFQFVYLFSLPLCPN